MRLSRLLVALVAASLWACGQATIINCSYGACCNTTSKVVQPKDTPCRAPRACLQEAKCDGQNSTCPTGPPKKDGLHCPWRPWISRPDYAAETQQDSATVQHNEQPRMVRVSADKAASMLASTPAYGDHWPECRGNCYSGECALAVHHPKCCYIPHKGYAYGTLSGRAVGRTAERAAGRTAVVGSAPAAERSAPGRTVGPTPGPKAGPTAPRAAGPTAPRAAGPAAPRRVLNTTDSGYDTTYNSTDYYYTPEYPEYVPEYPEYAPEYSYAPEYYPDTGYYPDQGYYPEQEYYPEQKYYPEQEYYPAQDYYPEQKYYSTQEPEYAYEPEYYPGYVQGRDSRRLLTAAVGKGAAKAAAADKDAAKTAADDKDAAKVSSGSGHWVDRDWFCWD